MITKATAFLGVTIKFDDRHRFHCLVLTDTYLYTGDLTKGKTYSENQTSML